MAPECLRGVHTNLTSDVYTLGVLLYELIFRKCPHEPKENEKSLDALIE